MQLQTILCSLPLIAACSSIRTSFAPTNPAPRQLAPRPAESVTLYTLGLPDRPYAEIGIISASSLQWTGSSPSPLLALRRAAAQHGCDGVVVMGPHDRIAVSTGEETLAQGTTTVASEVRIVRGAELAHQDGYRTSYRGTCIVNL